MNRIKALFNCHLDLSSSLYELFNDSEFRTPTFIDTDFRKQSFADLFYRKLTDADKDDQKRKGDYLPEDDSEKRKDMLSTDYAKKKQMERDFRDLKAWKELTKPVPYMLHDWVPDKAKPIHNGGFERMPDNGSPVPYHLNGHPDLERKLPWDIAD